jgi:hypothetical protein
VHFRPRKKQRSNTTVSNTTFFKGFLSDESAAPDSPFSWKIIVIKPLSPDLGLSHVYVNV